VRRLSEFTPSYLELFTHLAVKYNVNVIGGSHFTVEDGKLYNIAYLFRRDGTLGKQYKLHITPIERKWWGVQGGKHVEVFDTDTNAPVLCDADADAENGRGLMLVDGLAKEWSYFFPPGGGKVVYCLLGIT